MPNTTHLAADEPHRLYQRYERRAETTKIRLQMAIGVGVTVLVLARFFYGLDWVHYPWLQHIGEWLHVRRMAELGPLGIVGRGLAYSSAVELAYTLFTPGPDEAIDPVLMGLAAAMLMSFSQIEAVDFPRAAGVVLYVIALAGLFAIKRHFIDKVRGKKEQQKQAGTAQPKVH